MFMEGEILSGCGEAGADRLVVWEQGEVWSSDRLYRDLGLSTLSNPPIPSGLDIRLNWFRAGFECFLCFLYLT